MIKKIKKQAMRLNRLIRTKKFKWFKGLILALAFTVTACVSFLAGFFLNRDDNLLYKNTISSSVSAQSPADDKTTSQSPCVTTVPETVTTTEATTTTKISVNGVLLGSKLLENLNIEDVEYKYTNSAFFKSKNSAGGVRMPLTKKSFTVTYDGIVTAGLDSSLITVSSDNDARKITVILPEAAITGHTIDDSSIKITDVKDNLVDFENDDDYSSVIEEQTPQMEQKAVDNGLLEKVYASCEESINEYIMQDPLIAEYYSVNFIISKN
ncbi:MAG: DUF4230 domain-containing protein [Oscillospiraceae bacterium]|nr:DUF4230 domain-containing protein [Oscillospiraceae bacterium]